MSEEKKLFDGAAGTATDPVILPSSSSDQDQSNSVHFPDLSLPTASFGIAPGPSEGSGIDDGEMEADFYAMVKYLSKLQDVE